MASAHRGGAGPVRASRRFTLAAAALLPLPVVMAALLPTSDAGLRLLLALGRMSLGEARFSASGVSGNLATGAVIEDLRVATGDLRLHADRLSLRVEPAALLQGKLRLAGVSVRVLTMEQVGAPSPSTSGLPVAPKLPLSLAIDDARIARIVIVHAGGSTELTDFATAFDWPRGGALALGRLQVTRGDASLAAQGRWAVAGPDAVSATLDWHYRFDDELIFTGTGSLEGDDTTLRFAQRLRTPLVATLAGEISLASDAPAWRATLELADLQQLPPRLGAGHALQLGGRLQAMGSGDTARIDGTLTARSEDYGDWRVELALGANTAALDIERLALIGDAGMRADLGGRVDLSQPTAPSARIVGGWTGLRWPLAGATVAESPQGNFTLEGDWGAYRLDAEARLRTGGLPETRMTLAAHGDPRQLTLDMLRADIGNGLATLTGRLAWAQEPAFELAGRWRDLDYRTADGRQIRSRDGRLSAAGTLETYRGEIDAALRVADFPAGRLRAKANGTRQDIAVTELAVEAGQGQFGGTASLDWSGSTPRGAAALRATAFDPALFAPAWPGRLDFAVHAEGTPAAWSLRIDELQGQLRGRKLAGSADLELTASRMLVRQLDLSAGAAVLAANGALGDGGRLQWHIEIPTLADLWPGARGRLSASGDVTGNLSQPATAGQLTAGDIEIADHALASLDAAWRLAPGSQGPQTLTLGARGVRTGEIRLDTLDIAADGEASRLAVDLRVAMADLRLDLGWLGRLDPGPRVDGALVRGRVERAAQPAFELIAPASLVVDGQAFELGRQCWRGAGSLCVSVTRDAQRGWQATLETDALLLEALPRLVDWQRGALTGKLVVAGQDGRLERADGGFSLPGDELPQLAAALPRIVHRGIELEVATRAQSLGITGRLAIEAPSAVPVTLTLNLSEGPWRLTDWRDWPANGSLRAQVAALAPWAANSEEIVELAGHGSVDLAFSGSLGAPDLRGDATLSVKHAQLSRLGTTLEDLDLRIAGANGRQLAVEGRLRAGPGSATVDGQLGTDAAGPWATLRIASQDLRVVDLPEASALVTSALELSLARDRARITGVVDIPEGHFAPRQGSPETERSADVVIAGAPPAATPGSGIDADVRVRLGQKVTVAAQGFSGRVLGELRITERPQRPARASGELNVVDGKFSAYGQSLEIVKARLLYTGQAIGDPAIDARAERVVRDVTAGLRVTGRVSAPRTTLYSKPEMADGEILSYLVIGQPLTRASSADASAMIGAAAALGLRGGNLVTRSLARSFGLDELQITGRPDEANLALNIGKYLSPRFYVGYGMGLMDRANTVRLRYLLAESWSIEAETGTRTGADLLYSIER